MSNNKGIIDKKLNPFFTKSACEQNLSLTPHRKDQLSNLFGQTIESIKRIKDFDANYVAFVAVRWGYAELDPLDGKLKQTKLLKDEKYNDRGRLTDKQENKSNSKYTFTLKKDKSLKERIIESEKLISKIDNGIENIRLSQLARILNLSFTDVCKLFEKENISIKLDPNLKISIELLKHLVLREPELSFPINSIEKIVESNLIEKINDNSNTKKLKELEEKIENLDAKPYTKSVILNQFARNEYVREYAKIRSNGRCELCDSMAPFIDVYGSPFLETHHVVFLSKGGDDSIRNVVALCPNCHRKIHNLNLEDDAKKLRSKLNT